VQPDGDPAPLLLLDVVEPAEQPPALAWACFSSVASSTWSARSPAARSAARLTSR
jgi:hypothetical protein